MGSVLFAFQEPHIYIFSQLAHSFLSRFIIQFLLILSCLISNLEMWWLREGDVKIWGGILLKDKPTFLSSFSGTDFNASLLLREKLSRWYCAHWKLKCQISLALAGVGPPVERSCKDAVSPCRKCQSMSQFSHRVWERRADKNSLRVGKCHSEFLMILKWSHLACGCFFGVWVKESSGW